MTRLQEIEARIAQIKTEIEQDDADIDALNSEFDRLTEERNGIRDTEQRRAELRSKVAGGEGIVTRRMSDPEPTEPTYNASSPEYRSAYLKNLMGQELTKEERAAFVHTTENTPNVIPTTMLTRIWNMMEEQHPILGDLTIYRTGTQLEIVKHTEIVQGDAKIVAEATANDDEQNTFAKVTLSGKDFSKHVDISYALERMSMDGFEDYLVNEISQRLGAAMAADVVAQIEGDMDGGNKANSTTAGEISFKELAALFGKLEGASDVVVYAKRGTVFNHLVGMVDTAKRPIFQMTAQEGARGAILGASIKFEDAIADGVLLIGDPKKVVYNMVQDIMIESDRDIKRHVITYSGYARGEGVLVMPKAFARLTVTE